MHEAFATAFILAKLFRLAKTVNFARSLITDDTVRLRPGTGSGPVGLQEYLTSMEHSNEDLPIGE